MVSRGGQYTRVEFTANLGFGEVVIAFVDFSSLGISFGVPQNVLIYGGTPEEPSADVVIQEYERITVHDDGKVVTHWAQGQGTKVVPSWDTTRSPLASWDMPWSMRFELNWTPEYLTFTRGYYTKPKPLTHKTCLKIPVTFENQAQVNVVRFAVVKPTDDIRHVQQVIPLQGQVWVLEGSWPWVLVTMSNTKNPRLVQLTSVGRNYR
jgi:hypothetical protein